MLLPSTSVAGALFPAFPGPEGALALALQHQLDEAERLAPDGLRALQRVQLEALVAHASASSAFWRDRLARAGYRPGAPLTWDVFERLPILSRVDVQQHEDALRAEPIPPGHGATHEANTSGSTGRPVRVVKTALSDMIWRAVTLRDHRWHRRDLSRKLAAIRFVKDRTRALPPNGERLEGWGPATDAVVRTGPCVLMSLWADPKDQAKWLRREDPGYLLTHPSNLRALADEFAARGKRLPSLHQVRTFSEMLPPDLRAYAQDVFGAPIVDLYSTQEAGNLALQCPDHVRYHAQAETVIVEVLDDDARPCAPGQVGRVVVTPLHNFATPLLRYDVGDLAEAGAPCPCGRNLPVIERILGRVRNLLVYPDGRRAWPIFRPDLFRQVAPVRQFQLVQNASGIVLRLVVERPLAPAEEEGLRAILATHLGHPFPITFEYTARIERDSSGKYEDFRSEIASR